MKTDDQFIQVQAVFGCTHKAMITTTIDNAGPDIAMAANEVCPSCDQAATEAYIDEIEAVEEKNYYHSLVPSVHEDIDSFRTCQYRIHNNTKGKFLCMIYAQQCNPLDCDGGFDACSECLAMHSNSQSGEPECQHCCQRSPFIGPIQQFPVDEFDIDSDEIPF